MDKIRTWMDNVRRFLTSAYFDGHHKKKVHIVQLVLVALMIILSGTRVAVKPKGIPVTRADTLGIVMVCNQGTRQSQHDAEKSLGYQNIGRHHLSACDHTRTTVQAMGEPKSILDSQFHGNSLLVRGGDCHVHGHIHILPRCQLWIKLDYSIACCSTHVSHDKSA
jgi:hypothetical protein